jgi:hypothetical protein
MLPRWIRETIKWWIGPIGMSLIPISIGVTSGIYIWWGWNMKVIIFVAIEILCFIAINIGLMVINSDKESNIREEL